MAHVQYIPADDAHAVICDACGGNTIAYLTDPAEAAEAGRTHGAWHAEVAITNMASILRAGMADLVRQRTGDPVEVVTWYDEENEHGGGGASSYEQPWVAIHYLTTGGDTGKFYWQGSLAELAHELVG